MPAHEAPPGAIGEGAKRRVADAMDASVVAE